MEDLKQRIAKRIFGSRNGKAQGKTAAASTMSGWEKKGAPKQLVILRNFAAYHNISADYLLCLIDEPESWKREKDLSEDEKEILETYRMLDTAGKLHLWQTVKLLKRNYSLRIVGGDENNREYLEENDPEDS